MIRKPTYFVIRLLDRHRHLCAPLPAEQKAGEVFVTIGGGDFSGVYFPAGLAIAKMLNKMRADYGIRATVESTPASSFTT